MSETPLSVRAFEALLVMRRIGLDNDRELVARVLA
jgi:hypothetical protein